jgi:hypothetical protein
VRFEGGRWGGGARVEGWFRRFGWDGGGGDGEEEGGKADCGGWVVGRVGERFFVGCEGVVGLGLGG